MMRSTPCRARARAVLRPRPRLAPVTIATLLSEFSMVWADIEGLRELNCVALICSRRGRNRMPEPSNFLPDPPDLFGASSSTTYILRDRNQDHLDAPCPRGCNRVLYALPRRSRQPLRHGHRRPDAHAVGQR